MICCYGAVIPRWSLLPHYGVVVIYLLFVGRFTVTFTTRDVVVYDSVTTPVIVAFFRDSFTFVTRVG